MSGRESVKAWFSRLRPSSAKTAEFHLNQFLKWMRENGGKFKDFTPDQLVEYQKEAGNGERFDILDMVQRYVLESTGRTAYKRKRYTFVRSLFLHNRAELPRDKSFNIRGDMAKVVGTLTADEIKRVVLSSKPAYQAAFLCLLQGGMGKDEFIYWNEHGYEGLIEGLRGDPEVVKVDLPGRKSLKFEKPYHTYLGRDAIDAIRNWLRVRPEDAVAIFTDQLKKPISKTGLQNYWIKHLRTLGIVKPRDKSIDEKMRERTRTGKNLHEMRDVFRSLWEKSPAKGSVAEYCMGHVVDPLEYNKAFKDESYTRREYLKAVPFLNIMTSQRAFGMVDEDEVEQLRRKVRELEAGQSSEVQTLRREIEDLKRMFYERLSEVAS